jgi:molybdopterin-guanine dinucleotide biosynthesis protein A
MSQPISVGILAGGQSTRMGTDKALLPLPPNDKTLMQIVIERVQPLGEDIFVVSRMRPEYERFGVPLRPDLYADAAVLGGIGSALRHARCERCLVVSCDHPFLATPLLSAMAAAEGEWDVLIPSLPGESRQGGKFVRQTLHAVYRKTCIPAIERAISNGRFHIVSFFDDVRVCEIGLESIAQFDPDLRSFFSVNTPDAYEAARKMLSP